MDSEPGPVRLLSDDALPRPGDRRVFEGLAARLAADLHMVGGGLSKSTGRLAESSGDAFAPRTAPDANDLARAVAGQPIAASSPRPDVVAAINAIEPLIDGLTGDIVRDLNKPLPQPWTFPPMPKYKIDDGGGGGDWREHARLMGRLVTWFNAHKGRGPTDAERTQFTNWWEGVNPVSDSQFDEWVEDTFGEEPPPPNEHARQRGVFAQWFQSHKGRGPSTSEYGQFDAWWDANEPVTDDQLQAWAQATFPDEPPPPNQKELDRAAYRAQLISLFQQYLNRPPNDGELGTFNGWFDGAWPITGSQFQAWVVATFGPLLNI